MNNDQYKISNPFTGWPKTTPFQDGIGYSIKARHLTPKRYTGRLYTAAIFLNISLVSLFLLWLSKGDNVSFNFPLWCGAIAVITYFLPWWHKKTLIQLTPETFQLKSLMGWKSYNQGNIAFHVDYHEKARKEQERQEDYLLDMQLRGKRLKPSFSPFNNYLGKEYRNTFTVWMVYFGQSIPICHIFDPTQNKPRSLLERLSAVNGLITQQEFIDYWADLGGCPFTEGIKKQQHEKKQKHQNKANHNESQERPRDKAAGMSYEEALRLFGLENEGLTFEMLKKKVRSFRSKFHPDKGEGSTPIMQQINEAYEVIRKHKGW